jgi:hypothetical protein
VAQSLDTLAPNAHVVTEQQIVSLLRPHFPMYGERIAGLIAIKKNE